MRHAYLTPALPLLFSSVILVANLLLPLLFLFVIPKGICFCLCTTAP